MKSATSLSHVCLNGPFVDRSEISKLMPSLSLFAKRFIKGIRMTSMMGGDREKTAQSAARIVHREFALSIHDGAKLRVQ
jgi:hypothetical protein